MIIDWDSILKKTFKKCSRLTSGKNADYIPELKRVNPNLFAISVFTVDGEEYNIGDFNKEVAIESVSKIFSLALALETRSIDEVNQKIGNLKTNHVFNSVVSVENTPLHTLNSFHNAGAMATTSLTYVPHRSSFQKRIYDTLSAFAGRRLHMSKPIYQSEITHSDHNHSLAYLLHSYGRFYAPVEPTVDVYTRQCSALVTSRDIAKMASILANDGVQTTGKKKRLLQHKHVLYILNHMQNHGLYESSNKFLQDVGYPAKSGVGGVILMVIPGVAGIGIVSPPLDKHGNSVKGQCSAKEISALLRFRLHN
jgi:glutaminase